MTDREELTWFIIIAAGIVLYYFFIGSSVEAGSTGEDDDANPSVSGTVLQLAQAIAKEEGFYAAGASQNIPQRANNPLDLELGDQGYGTLSAAGGQKITVFPTLAAGWAAAVSQLTKDIAGTKLYPAGESISQFMQMFTSGSNTSTSAGTNAGNQVANNLGVPSSTPVSDY